jgi:MtaA/CmuA family methyltransferase
MTGLERVVTAIEGGKLDRLPLMPITMMFAADRANVSYRDYVTDYRVLVDAQLRVAEEFDFDFVSAISDPAREAADCGAAIKFFDNQPPAIDEAHARLADKLDLRTLQMPDPLGGGRMHDRVKAVTLFKERAGGRLLIEGWIEGPIAEAADLRGINTLMMDFYEAPEFVQDLFDFVVEMELRFAKAQINAGADIIGLGDAAASLIGPQLYDQYVWPYEKKVVEAIHGMGGRVRLHICGNTRPILEGMGRLGCDIVDLDYLAPLSEARAAMGPAQALLGNIDPVSALKNGTPESIRAALAQCHAEAGAKYIVSAGCEVVRDTPEPNMRAMQEFAGTTEP